MVMSPPRPDPLVEGKTQPPGCMGKLAFAHGCTHFTAEGCGTSSQPAHGRRYIGRRCPETYAVHHSQQQQRQAAA